MESWDDRRRMQQLTVFMEWAGGCQRHLLIPLRA